MNKKAATNEVASSEVRVINGKEYIVERNIRLEYNGVWLNYCFGSASESKTISPLIENIAHLRGFDVTKWETKPS